MTEQQMASDIKWHRLDDMDDSTYPKKIGELYLVRIYNRDKGHHYGIARLWDKEEYMRKHPNATLPTKGKYVFASDGTDQLYRRKSEGYIYIDGWNDPLFTAITTQSTRVSRYTPASPSDKGSKVWVDLRNKNTIKLKKED